MFYKEARTVGPNSFHQTGGSGLLKFRESADSAYRVDSLMFHVTVDRLCNDNMDQAAAIEKVLIRPVMAVCGYCSNEGLRNETTCTAAKSTPRCTKVLRW